MSELMTEPTSESKYFNLILKGLGYVNDIRLVELDNTEPFWSCNLSALRGAVDKAEYTYFSCSVAGKKAQKLIEKMKPYSDSDQKILIGYECGNLKARPFIFEKGASKGKAGVNLQVSLLSIKWVKVDGEEIYRPQPITPLED
jgi:hypothetical protein